MRIIYKWQVAELRAVNLAGEVAAYPVHGMEFSALEAAQNACDRMARKDGGEYIPIKVRYTD